MLPHRQRQGLPPAMASARRNLPVVAAELCIPGGRRPPARSPPPVGRPRFVGVDFARQSSASSAAGGLLPGPPAGLLRCSKSCRLRWINHLRPNLKRGIKFAEDEDDLIIKLHALLGNRWSLIAARLPGRTGNEVKNHWNSHLIRRKLLVDMGVDHLSNHQRLGKYRFLGNTNYGGRFPSTWAAEVVPAGSLGVHRCSSSCAPTFYSHAGDDRPLLSDEAGSRQDGTRLLPDLNLDRNINFGLRPSMFLHGQGGRRQQQHHEAAEEDMKEGIGESSPTLLLFK